MRRYATKYRINEQIYRLISRRLIFSCRVGPLMKKKDPLF